MCQQALFSFCFLVCLFAFSLYLERTAKRQTVKGERGGDTQQRATGWSQTRATAEDLTSVQRPTLYQVSYPGTTEGHFLLGK